MYECHKCKALFSSEKKLRDHSNRKKVCDMVNVCNKCKQFYATERGLENHKCKIGNNIVDEKTELNMYEDLETSLPSNGPFVVNTPIGIISSDNRGDVIHLFEEINKIPKFIKGILYDRQGYFIYMYSVELKCGLVYVNDEWSFIPNSLITTKFDWGNAKSGNFKDIISEEYLYMESSLKPYLYGDNNIPQEFIHKFKEYYKNNSRIIYITIFLKSDLI